MTKYESMDPVGIGPGPRAEDYKHWWGFDHKKYVHDMESWVEKVWARGTGHIHELDNLREHHGEVANREVRILDHVRVNLEKLIQSAVKRADAWNLTSQHYQDKYGEDSP